MSRSTRTSTDWTEMQIFPATSPRRIAVIIIYSSFFRLILSHLKHQFTLDCVLELYYHRESHLFRLINLPARRFEELIIYLDNIDICQTYRWRAAQKRGRLGQPQDKSDGEDFSRGKFKIFWKFQVDVGAWSKWWKFVEKSEKRRENKSYFRALLCIFF